MTTKNHFAFSFRNFIAFGSISELNENEHTISIDVLEILRASLPVSRYGYRWRNERGMMRNRICASGRLTFAHSVRAMFESIPVPGLWLMKLLLPSLAQSE
jgi:hypothetical protein